MSDFTFRCSQCDNEVRVHVAGFVAHIEDDIEAWCRGAKFQHPKPVRMQPVKSEVTVTTSD